MANKNILLVTRPVYDEPTHYLSVWSQKVTDVASEKGVRTIELDKNAKRNILEWHLAKSDPRLVVFNGHGKEDLITGYKMDEILVRAGDNESILKGRIACAISCNSAKALGPKSITAGATAFIGFEEKFAFFHEESHSAVPIHDKIAAYFLDPPNLVPISLLKGNSVEESYRKSQDAFEKSIEYFETHYTPENMHILFVLRYDKLIQQAHGDKDAYL